MSRFGKPSGIHGRMAPRPRYRPLSGASTISAASRFGAARR
jgi:hypothetical protein